MAGVEERSARRAVRDAEKAAARVCETPGGYGDSSNPRVQAAIEQVVYPLAPLLDVTH